MKQRPRVVCLCGSTRFWKTFQEQSLRLTKVGVIVLSIGSATGSDADHGITPEEKAIFDELHKRKIELADEILVLNVGGYIGESTRAEIDHAITNGKRVVYLEPIGADERVSLVTSTPTTDNGQRTTDQ